MRQRRKAALALLASGSAVIAGAPVAGAQTDAPDPGTEPNPDLVDARAAAAASASQQEPPSSASPAPVGAGTSGGSVLAAAAGCIRNGSFSSGHNAHHCHTSTSTLNGVGGVRSVIPNDWARNDSPGFWTTTARIDGTDWVQTDSGQTVDAIRLIDHTTISVFGVTGVSVSGGGVGASAGTTSATSERDVTVRNTWYNQFQYTGGGQWVVKAPNWGSSPAKVTRRAKGTVTYKNASAFPEANYSFWY
ncbi:MAG: hypothetical protein R2716_13245 [Microthrixaceae bacterium]